MKAKAFVALIALSITVSMVPLASAGTVEFVKVDHSPNPYYEGDTLHVTAKITSTSDLSKVLVFPCWELPTYTCGMPSEMNDTDGDGVYEVDLNNDNFYEGNTLHINFTAEDVDGVVVKHAMDPFVVGQDTNKAPEDILNEADCKDALYYWWHDACNANEIAAGNVTDENECDARGWFWYASICNAVKGDPKDYDNKDPCLGVGYYWYDGKCHLKKKPAEPGFIPGFETFIVLAAIVTVGFALRKRRKG